MARRRGRAAGTPAQSEPTVPSGQGEEPRPTARPDAADTGATQSSRAHARAAEGETPSGPAGGRGSAGPERARLEVDVFTGPESAFFATSALVLGPRHALLVDTQLTRSAGRELAEWVAGRARTLAAIVITHPHPDHYFGTEEVLRLFPGTPVYADAGVIEEITRTGLAKVVQWQQVFGDDVTSGPIVPGPLPTDTMLIDGSPVHMLAVGQGDCATSTVVHVPDARTVISGDVAFNGTHLWTADTTRAQRADWLASLETVRGLDPVRVVAGHRAPGQDDDAARVLAFTGDYLREFDAHLSEHPGDPDAVMAAVNETYGELTLPGMLHTGVHANTSR
ncbi:MBL fold metallo-hydrolase [Streptacidiphilus neutrinimicus]|uniref:MBL fold metallo-hydrolase n=1 Tax=Streptacidiphilus neutrinimicus TaxID=105420 RepID=UPI0005A77EDD|nr:MBL fold metallo-hydrolase [Streptacidiphilus neutrinimicus]